MNVLEIIPKARARSKQAKQQAKFKSTAPKSVRKPALQDTFPLPGNLRSRLNGVRSSQRMVGIGIGLSMLIGAISILFLTQGFSDWWFDIPWIGRALLLIADIVILAWIYRRWLDRPLRHRLTLAEASLLVEKKWPNLRQCIITTVEMAEGSPNVTRGSKQLLDILLQQTVMRTSNLKFGEVVPFKPLRRWLILGGVAFLGTLTIAAATFPASFTLLERIFLLNVALPTKTIVQSITGDMVIPLGSDAVLSAKATGVVIPTHGRITISYAGSPSEDVVVTASPDKDDSTINDTYTYTVRNVQKPFKYIFYLGDGHGQQYTVDVKIPPAVANLTCTQTYPAYTKLDPLTRKLAPTDLSLLAGSDLKIEADATDNLQSATIVLQTSEDDTDTVSAPSGPITGGVPGATPTPPTPAPPQIPKTIAATLDSKTHFEAKIHIPAKNLTGFSIHLVGESTLSTSNETVYPIVIVPDNPPVLKFIAPEDERETITLRTKPDIIFEASDDFGLTKLSIKYQLVPPQGPEGASVITTDDTSQANALPVVEIPITLHPVVAGKPYDKRYEYILDVAAQNPAWKEGYSVNYWIEAVDNNDVTGPGISKTESKQFGIISVEDKLKEILEREKTATEQLNKAAGVEDNISTNVKEGIPENGQPPPDAPAPAPPK